MIKEIVLEEIKNIDEQFCKECESNGVDGWVKYFANDGVMITDGDRENIIGKENIYEYMKGFFSTPSLKFQWEPRLIDVSDDLSLGYTSGVYVREYNKEGKSIIEKGKYTTIWKKIDNEWKIILDIGN
ncbi:nuclear transport factor 2 family protein [Mycoplasmatota bacterium WC44]